MLKLVTVVLQVPKKKILHYYCTIIVIALLPLLLLHCVCLILSMLLMQLFDQDPCTLPSLYPLLQASPRIGAGRLSHDHRGDYFSESFSLLENPFSPSFSGSVTTSFGYGMDHSFVDKVLLCMQ